MAGRHTAPGRATPPGPGGRHSARPAAAAPIPVLLIVLVLVAVLGGGALAYLASRDHGAPHAGATPPPTPTASSTAAAEHRCEAQLPIPVVVSPELATVVTRLAADWQAGAPAIAGRCLSATVTPRDPARAAASLAGARTPVVWIPDSSVWTRRLPASHHLAVRSSGSLATSPLVVAAAPGAAAQLRREAGAGWTGVLGGRLPPRITDPATTAAGALVALGATAQAGTSTRGQSAVVGLFMRLQGHCLPSTAAAFSALRANPRATPAVVTSEQAVRAENARRATTVATPLYPRGATPMLDYPLVRVTPAGAAPLDVSAAAAFETVLRSPAGRAAFASVGLRDAAADPLPGTAPSGAPTPQVRPAAAPSAGVQATATRLWRAASKPSRMLAVIDVSGSMNDPARRGAPKKIVIAASAARAALGLLPDDWTVGLWTFATHRRPAKDWSELAPLRSVQAGRAHLLAAAASLPRRVGGNTALYTTALAAFTDVSAHYDPAAVNVVVLLTDGANVNPGAHLSRKQLLATLGKRYNPRKPVHIVTIAFGRDADVSTLRQIAAVTHGQSYRVSSAAQIQQVIVESIIANNR